jgi:hypothetical protein
MGRAAVLDLTCLAAATVIHQVILVVVILHQQAFVLAVHHINIHSNERLYIQSLLQMALQKHILQQKYQQKYPSIKS